MKMKKSLIPAVCMAIVLGSFAVQAEEVSESASQTEPDYPEQESITETAEDFSAEWPRDEYYEDENGNFLSVTWMEFDDEEGWYVGCMLGEDMYGGIIPLEGDVLTGNLAEPDSEEFIVTVSEEGEDGVLLELEDGEVYHFAPMAAEEAEITVLINTEGEGQIAYAGTEEELDFDEDFFTSLQTTLAEPGEIVIGAKTEEPGWSFVKWTKDGEDYADEPVITADVTEDTVFAAVFDYKEE